MAERGAARKKIPCEWRKAGESRRGEAGLRICSSRRGDGGSGDYVGGGREAQEASWMTRARLRRMERVSPMRVALAELFKPK
jgi:hypothetical protein